MMQGSTGPISRVQRAVGLEIIEKLAVILGCTHLYGVISRAAVSLIIRTGGACRPFRHDRHFNEASSFQIGVSRGRRMASSGRLARLAAITFHLKPAPPWRHCAIVGEGCAGPP